MASNQTIFDAELNVVLIGRLIYYISLLCFSSIDFPIPYSICKRHMLLDYLGSFFQSNRKTKPTNCLITLNNFDIE